MLQLGSSGCSLSETALLERPSRIWTFGRTVALATESGRSGLTEGWWEQSEVDGVGPFRWALGPVSTVQLVLSSEVTWLELEVAPAELPGPPLQRLDFQLDGLTLPSVDLTAGWQRIRVPLPASRPSGLVRLDIRPTRMLEPGTDPRPLTFRARTLEMGGAGPEAAVSIQPPSQTELRLPGFSVWALPMQTGRAVDLELNLRGFGAGRKQVRVLWQDASGTTQLERQSLTGALFQRVLRVRLPQAAGRLLIESQATPGAGTQLLAPRLLQPLPQPEPRPRTAVRPRNLVIYLFDALRADALGVYGMGRPTSPHLDRLTRRGRVFQRLVGHSAWTRPAVATLFTGLFPWSHRVQRREDALPASVLTMAERLAEEGLYTAAVAGNANDSAAFGFAQGFDHFVEGFALQDLLRRHPENPKLQSDDLTLKAVEALDAAGDRPFFLFLHSVDPHYPYVPPRSTANFEEPVSGEDQELRRYRACIRFNDEELGRLLGILQQRNLLDTTLLVLIADHGEEFGEHGGIHHGRTLYEEITHIPLILSGPGIASGIESRPLAMADLAPSLLQTMGFLQPGSQLSRGFDGRILDLAGDRTPGEEWIAGEEFLDGRSVGALRVGRYKLIRNRGRFQLFDLAQDPGEKTDLTDLRRREALEAELQLSVRSERPVQADKVDESKLDKRIEAELRALGYIE